MESRNRGRTGQNTPPTITTVDRNNGSHNAWGGFISRAVPANSEGGKAIAANKRSHTRSRSRSQSPDENRVRGNRKKSRHRSRSRTPSKYSKKKSRNYSKSPSSSPQNKHKKR